MIPEPSLVKSCMGKRRYKSPESAFSVAWKAMQERGTPLRIYYCPLCNGGYHLTRRPGLGVPDDDAEILAAKAELEKVKLAFEKTRLQKHLLANETFKEQQAETVSVRHNRLSSAAVVFLRQRCRDAYGHLHRGEIPEAMALLSAVVSIPKRYLSRPNSEVGIAFMEAHIRSKLTFLKSITESAHENSPRAGDAPPQDPAGVPGGPASEDEDLRDSEG